ncbi:AraC family transcriptional regulator [Aquabacterium sp. A3]|uniref:AraC family transcriptional regulator n=1 Tax=Aquabacterium sp. A3 TaxID=3132829 RepID=UPI00311A91C9
MNEARESILVKSLAQRLSELTPHEGRFATPLADVTLMRSDHDTEPATVFEEPAIVLALQGIKRGHLGDEVLTYGAGQGLVVSLPMSFQCDTVATRPGSPMLAIHVRINLETVRDVVTHMVDAGMPAPPAMSPRAMAVMTLDAPLLDVTRRLFTALASKVDAAVMGASLVRELHYRVLQSSAGVCLRELITWRGRVGTVLRSIECLRAQLDKDWQVADLAREASLSSSAYHAAFKDLTGQTPMQYLKTARLHRARQLLGLTSRSSAEVAFEVGYQSPSQFSRDYKRQFGVPPSQDRGTSL